MKIKLYGKTLMFRKGEMLSINLTYRCNLPCSYCSLELPTGIRPKAEFEYGLEDWKRVMREFPHKVREIYVSGGEPSSIPFMPELVNWLLDEGYHVIVFSNLFKPEEFLRIKKSYRFKIQASYHRDDSDARFHRAYMMLKDYHRVDVDEIHVKVLPYSILKPYTNTEVLKTDYGYRFSPDGELFKTCYSHYVAKSA